MALYFASFKLKSNPRVRQISMVSSRKIKGNYEIVKNRWFFYISKLKMDGKQLNQEKKNCAR